MTALLAIANGTLLFVLNLNLALDIYPIEADSIGIPMIESFVVSLLLFVFFASAIYLPKKTWLGMGAALALLTMACLVSVLSLISWAIPHHYAIAVAYGIVSVGCCWLGYMLFRQKRTSNSQPTNESE